MSGIEKHVGAADLTGKGTLTVAGYATVFATARLARTRSRIGSAKLTGSGSLVADGVVTRPA